jgi:hypothetical protein
LKEDDFYTYLDLRPKSQTDRANFTRMRVVLLRQERWVRQLWVQEASGRSITIDYEEPDTDPQPPVTPELILKDFVEPGALDGTKGPADKKK